MHLFWVLAFKEIPDNVNNCCWVKDMWIRIKDLFLQDFEEILDENDSDS